jgi:flagellar hook-length control protein FliK
MPNQVLSAGALENSAKETSQVISLSGNNVAQPTNTMGKDGISQQIFESIHGSLQKGQQQITIQLNPPELGRILIKFQESDEKITGLLEVSKSETRHEIEQALPEILKTLQDAGIQFKRLEVTVNEQSSQQLTKEQNLQGDNFGQNGPGGSDNSDYMATDQESANDNLYHDFDQPQLINANETLNVLI